MKKIEFGYANEMNPSGSWQGIGIKEGLLLPAAEYYGAVSYEDNSYIIAKVIEDEYKRYPELLGKFIVRPAIADLYKDGSGNIFLNQEETLVTKQLESHLNNPQISEKINNFNDILNFTNGINRASNAFTFLTMDDKIISTSITNEEFERKNNAIKNCHDSFSVLSEKANSNTFGR